MSDIHFVEEGTYGNRPAGSMLVRPLIEHLPEIDLKDIKQFQEGVPGRHRASPRIRWDSNPAMQCRLSILAPKQIKQLFGCERIEVKVPSIELEFRSGPVQTLDDPVTAYKMAGSRVAKLKAGKYQVNLKRWEPIVKFETEAPAPRWPRIVAAALWVARKAGMQSSTKVDIHCGPQDTSTLEVKYQWLCKGSEA